MSITEERPARRDPAPRKRKTARRTLVSGLRRAAGLGWPVALALALCLSALAVDAWAARRSERSPAANRALVDKARTGAVVADVSAKVARIFTEPAGGAAQGTEQRKRYEVGMQRVGGVWKISSLRAPAPGGSGP